MDLPVPSSEKHSVNEQMIFSIIPIIDLWAFFRIEKLRIYLVISLGLAVMNWTIAEAGGYGASIAFWIFFSIPVCVYLIRMWTLQWNEKMDLEMKEESDSIVVETIEGNSQCVRCSRLISSRTEDMLCNSCRLAENP